MIDKNDKLDITIVGAGVIGCAVAYELGRCGAAVRVLEEGGMRCDDPRAARMFDKVGCKLERGGELIKFSEKVIIISPKRGRRTLIISPTGFSAEEVGRLRKLADEGTTVILSTHTLEVVDQVCDSVAIIDRGKIITCGTLEEVRKAHGAEEDRLEELFLRLTAESDEDA